MNPISARVAGFSFPPSGKTGCRAGTNHHRTVYNRALLGERGGESVGDVMRRLIREEESTVITFVFEISKLVSIGAAEKGAHVPVFDFNVGLEDAVVTEAITNVL
jgi:hypothetical protein